MLSRPCYMRDKFGIASMVSLQLSQSWEGQRDLATSMLSGKFKDRIYVFGSHLSQGIDVVNGTGA